MHNKLNLWALRAFFKRNPDVRNYLKMMDLPLGESDTIYYAQSEPFPKHKFKGQVYLLIDGRSGSASVNLASGFKANKLGTMCGESCLGPLSGTWGNPAGFRLPNSGLNVYISTIRFNANDEFGTDPSPINPDIEIDFTPADIAEGVDPVLEFIRGEMPE
jgi:C-terminal processing protease CtpA/Prc